MQTDATCWAQQCCVLLANNVASVCMGLKVWPVSNYTQQVPTLLWFHSNGRNMLGPTMLRVVGQQCCVRLHGPLAWTFIWGGHFFQLGDVWIFTILSYTFSVCLFVINKTKKKKECSYFRASIYDFFFGGGLVIFVVFRVSAYSKLGAYLNMYGILAEFDVGNSLWMHADKMRECLYASLLVVILLVTECVVCIPCSLSGLYALGPSKGYRWD